MSGPLLSILGHVFGDEIKNKEFLPYGSDVASCKRGMTAAQIGGLQCSVCVFGFCVCSTNNAKDCKFVW